MQHATVQRTESGVAADMQNPLTGNDSTPAASIPNAQWSDEDQWAPTDDLGMCSVVEGQAVAQVPEEDIMPTLMEVDATPTGPELGTEPAQWAPTGTTAYVPSQAEPKSGSITQAPSQAQVTAPIAIAQPSPFANTGTMPMPIATPQQSPFANTGSLHTGTEAFIFGGQPVAKAEGIVTHPVAKAAGLPQSTEDSAAQLHTALNRELAATTLGHEPFAERIDDSLNVLPPGPCANPPTEYIAQRTTQVARDIITSCGIRIPITMWTDWCAQWFNERIETTVSIGKPHESC